MGSAHTEILEALLRAPNTSKTAEIRAALSRLSAEVKARLNRGSSSSFDFFSDALRVLSRLKGSTHSELRMECLFDCASFFYHSGNPGKALECAKQLDGIAAHARNALWMRKAHTLSGVVHADIGNVADALIHHARALELARKHGETEGEIRELINTGVALNYAGLYREAIPCFKKSAAMAQSSQAWSALAPAAYIDLAQSYFYLEQFSEGFRAAETSLALSTEPVDSPTAIARVVREFTFVQLALELGKISAARDHSVICTRYAHWSQSVRGKVLADIANALCEVHGGTVDRGLSMLEASLQKANDIEATRVVVLVSLVKAYDEASQPDKALHHMKSLLNHIRSKREVGLETLLSEGTLATSEELEATDLRALELREARLVAQVADRETASSRIEMLERLAVTADLREEMSGEHGYRVGRLASLMAEELNWPREACHAIDLAARLHDIGKIAVPDRILLNSQELKDAERHFMSTHTIIGAELLAKSNIPQLRMAEDIARCHHEWWNGEGYPARLAGKRIPIHARIVALADVFDALTHGRPFAKPWPMDRALEEIRTRRESQFDPELTDLFLKLVQRLRGEHRDLDGYLGRAGRNSPFLQARNKIRLMLAEEREREKKAVVRGNETRH